MEVGLSPGDFVLDGDPDPFPKSRRSPQFSAQVHCGQTAGWIKMALGMEVGVDPVHIVLVGDTAPFPKRAEPPIFDPSLLWPNGWCLSPGDVVLDRDPAPSPKGGALLNFRPTSIVVKRLHGSGCHLVRR